MALPKLEGLREFLQTRGIACVSEIREGNSDDIDFVLYVPGDRVSRRVDAGRTSVRQMTRLCNDIKKQLKLNVEWIITQDDRVADLEAALRGAFEARFPGIFTAVSVSALHVSPSLVSVETDPQAINRPGAEHLSEIAASIFSAYGVEPPTVFYGDGLELPSIPMILRGVKTGSPATAESLADRLRQSRTLIPDLTWLRRKLDTLRREGLVVRISSGAYAMTEKGLGIVPHGRSRSSSDVERVLALARRKW